MGLCVDFLSFFWSSVFFFSSLCFWSSKLSFFLNLWSYSSSELGGRFTSHPSPLPPSLASRRLQGFVFDSFGCWDQVFANQNSSTIQFFKNPYKISKIWPDGLSIWVVCSTSFGTNFLYVSQLPENSYFAACIMRNAWFCFPKPPILASKPSQIMMFQDTFFIFLALDRRQFGGSPL